MAVKLDGKPWTIREQIIEDRLTGLTFQFEVLPDGTARFQVFGSPLPFGNREFLFDADGAEAGDIHVVAAGRFAAVRPLVL